MRELHQRYTIKQVICVLFFFTSPLFSGDMPENSDIIQEKNNYEQEANLFNTEQEHNDSNNQDTPDEYENITESTSTSVSFDPLSATFNLSHQEDEIEDFNEYDDTDNQEFLEEGNLDEKAPLPIESRIISDIIVENNVRVSREEILSRVPYEIGSVFKPRESGKAIRNLYLQTQRFENITIEAELVDHDKVIIYIFVVEKPILKEVKYKGNSKVSEKEIEKKIDFKEIPTITEVEAKRYARIIKRIYTDKGYFLTQIEPELIRKDDYATLIFNIKESKKSCIRQIKFNGNKKISGKTLRAAIFSKEDWLLGFMDGSGSYHPDRLEADKHYIEQFYQNNGYLNAKVTNVSTWLNPKNSKVTITFDINEGEQYTIKEVHVSGNGIIKDEYLQERIPLRAGMIYSREKMIDAMKGLEYLWSDMGYMYSHIEPSLQPDEDTKTITIAFNTELGKPVYLNKVTIRGNKKTRDKIIRRQLRVDEGGLITTQAMEVSKNRVQSLGYFDQKDGVNWKTTRISDDLADLDLIVKEAPTGNAHVKLGFGGIDDLSSVASGVSLEGNISDSNLFGSGIQFNLVGKLAKGEQDILFNLTQPWLFDKPIFGAIDASHKRMSYEQLHFTNVVNELRTTGSGTIGFATGLRRFPFFNDTFVRFAGGVDKVRYERPPVASPTLLEPSRTQYQTVLNKLFDPGSFGWVTVQLGQDKKNHPMHPSRGHTWLFRTQVAIPGFNANIGFAKFDLDANWFTPLIGDYDLVFRLHGYAGFIALFGDRFVPYRDLYHIGGPASVRGFLYGQVGPQFSPKVNNQNNVRDSIGGKKALFFNAELIFPITPDLTMKGLLFYDGGTGWNFPYSNDLSPQFIENNGFNYRHSVGCGIRILQPMPIKVDCGYKIDPRKGETGYEVHFSMSYDW